MKRLILVAFLALGATAPAQASWFGQGYLPTCDSNRVLNSVVKKFSYANSRTFHWGVTIDSISETFEVPEQIVNDSSIGRRYCRGLAWMSDGSRSEVIYLIEARQGFASVGWRVQSCLPAYDPWHVYGAWCHSIEP